MKYLALTAVIALAGCDTLKAPDYLDAATTAGVIAQGGAEMNPIIGFAGDSAAPLVSLGGKYVIREHGDLIGLTPAQSDLTANAAGWLGGCNNLVHLVANVELTTSLTVGALCAAWSIYNDQEKLSQ